MDQTGVRTRWNYYDTLSSRTTRQWAKLLESADQIPLGFVQDFPKDITPFPYTLLVPPDSISFRHFFSASLISILDDKIVVLSQKGNKVHSRNLFFDQINHLETGNVLLNSWITIKAPGFSITIPHNTVHRRLFDPLISRIRNIPPSDPFAEITTDTEKAKLNYLFRIDYKYGSYGRDAIAPGSKVMRILYEKNRLAGYYGLFGIRFMKKIRTSHCSILTDRELITIRESESLKKDNQALYGKVITFTPLSSIQDILLTKEKASQFITITLSGGDTVSTQYGLENDETQSFVNTAADAAKTAGIVTLKTNHLH
jgi:hypothetical protein